MKAQFSTSLDKDVLNDFRAVCEKEGVHMKDVIEVFMRGYSQKRFRLMIEYDKKLEREAKAEKRVDKIIKNAHQSYQR